MNILSIGANDHAHLSDLLQRVATQPVELFHTDDIALAPSLMVQHQIALFICDLKFGEVAVRSLISALGDDPSTFCRGVFISDEADYGLSIFGLNSYLINDYILRPYDEERIEEMWWRNKRGRYQRPTVAV